MRSKYSEFTEHCDGDELRIIKYPLNDNVIINFFDSIKTKEKKGKERKNYSSIENIDIHTAVSASNFRQTEPTLLHLDVHTLWRLWINGDPLHGIPPYSTMKSTMFKENNSISNYHKAKRVISALEDATAAYLASIEKADPPDVPSLSANDFDADSMITKNYFNA